MSKSVFRFFIYLNRTNFFSQDIPILHSFNIQETYLGPWTLRKYTYFRENVPNMNATWHFQNHTIFWEPIFSWESLKLGFSHHWREFGQSGCHNVTIQLQKKLFNCQRGQSQFNKLDQFDIRYFYGALKLSIICFSSR